MPPGGMTRGSTRFLARDEGHADARAGTARIHPELGILPGQAERSGDRRAAVGHIWRATCMRCLVSMHSGPPHTDPQRRARGQPLGGRRWRTVTSDCRLAADDTRPARPDLAGFLVGYLDTSERRRHENRLLEMYYSVLIHGITGYSFEQCWDDYRMALVLPTAIARHCRRPPQGLTATPDGDWNVVFPRYAQALPTWA